MKPHLTVPQTSQTFGRPGAQRPRTDFDALETDVPTTQVQSRARILLVNADPLALLRLDARLSGAGYEVAAVPTFHGARDLFDSIGPDLVIAAIRLEAFNGLHLAGWVRFEHPSVPVIITHTEYDQVLEREAQRFNAKFVTSPLENPDFLQHVRAAVGEPRLARRMVGPQ
jgi:DNA-binding response OmpR family regulator